MNRALLTALVIAGATLATGCSTIVNDGDQVVSVQADASDITDARVNCTIRQGNDLWTVAAGSSISVDRGYKDLNIECLSIDERAEGQLIAASDVKTGETILYSGVGNAIFGGLIGVGVDAMTGVNMEYDGVLNVPMRAVEGVKVARREEAPQPFDTPREAIPAELLDFQANQQCVGPTQQVLGASNARGTHWEVDCRDGEVMYAQCIGGICYVR